MDDVTIAKLRAYRERLFVLSEEEKASSIRAQNFNNIESHRGRAESYQRAELLLKEFFPEIVSH